MAWTRETPWRQGNVISPADAVALGLTKNGDEKAIVVVISHDCDLAVEDLSEEPSVEVILGRRIPQGHGNYSFAKHPRRLHLDVTRCEDHPLSYHQIAQKGINGVTAESLEPTYRSYLPVDLGRRDWGAEGIPNLRIWYSAAGTLFRRDSGVVMLWPQN